MIGVHPSPFPRGHGRSSLPGKPLRAAPGPGLAVRPSRPTPTLVSPAASGFPPLPGRRVFFACLKNFVDNLVLPRLTKRGLAFGRGWYAAD